MGNLWCLNVGCADTSIIKTDSDDYFMIDCYDGLSYNPYLPNDKKIKALFITHQHYDHFQGMKYLIDEGYTIEYLIYSPYERRRGDNSVEYEEWQEFSEYANYFERQGSKIYKPYRPDSLDKAWWKPSGLTIWIFGPHENIAISSTRELHDASLVITIESPKRSCVFTGDASDKSLNLISRTTKNYCNDILHASHHGSINGADLDFIKKANAQYTIISTKSGVHDSIPHPNALKRYENNTSGKVYRTDKSGTLKFNF